MPADDEAHLAGLQRVARHALGREHAQLLDAVDGVGGHHADALALAERPSTTRTSITTPT
jgi:hypothetical protein